MSRSSLAWRLGRVAAAALLPPVCAACGSSDRGAPPPSGTPTATASVSTGSTPSPVPPPVTRSARSLPSDDRPTSTPAGPTAAARSTKAPPPATTPVPAPTPGDISETVPTGQQPTKRPVKLDETAQTGRVQAELLRIQAITARASLPGEVQGPALAFTVRLENSGRSSVKLDAVVVTLTDSGGNPCTEMTAKPARPFSGVLRPGKSARGVYVFTIAKDRRKPVSLDLSLGGTVPVLSFTGETPDS